MIQFDEKNIAAQALEDLKTMSKVYWDSWTDGEKKLVAACIEDAAKLGVRALNGESIAKEKNLVDAQLKAIKVAGKATAKDVVWTYVARVIQGLIHKVTASLLG